MKKYLKESKINTTNKKALFVDVDHTIVDGSTPVLFLRFLLKNKIITKKTFFKGLLYELLFYLGIIRYNSTIKMQLYFKKSNTNEIVNEIIQRFWQEEVKPRIFKEVLGLIKSYKKSDYKIVMISATPDIILRPLEKFLNVDYNLSSKIIINRDGFKIIRYAMKWNKYRIIKKFARENKIDLKKSVSCSDGKNDIPMLLACKEKLVVNPKIFVLIIAFIKRWKILRFKEHLESK